MVERAATGPNQVVVGAPGSGKTTVAFEAYLRRAATEPDHAQVPGHYLLVPSRIPAGRLRAQAGARLIAAGSARRSPAVMTPAAFAFGIVRRDAVSRRVPPPMLITGAQQDRILADILEGHRLGIGARIDWPAELPRDVLAIPAFRDELRNLFMRADEFGIEPGELEDLGHERGQPEWVMAAQLQREYRDIVALGDLPADRGERFDVARIVSEAARIVEEGDGPRTEIASVVVDDYQEASAALVRLLTALADRGTHLTLVGDPDVAVQTFRGARPEFVSRAGSATGMGAFSAQRVVLPAVHRGGPRLRNAVETVVGHVPVSGTGTHRNAQVIATEAPSAATSAGREMSARFEDAPVVSMHLPSPATEAAAIAQELRHGHLHRGLGWDQMAVIVRSSRSQSELQRGLGTFHIPVTRADSAVVLREEPAVGLLLNAIEAGVGGVSPERAADLLVGEVGRLDDVGMRRLRRLTLARVRQGEFEEGHGIDEAIAELVSSAEGARSLEGDLGAAAGRVARVVEAARRAVEGPAASPQQVLWQVWDATGLAERWRTASLARGAQGARADANLDAVMALFEFAENYELRETGASAAQFVDHVRSESLPSDTLADRGRRGPGVEVLTVAQAAGREWELVVVAGVQDGSWPDTRVRDSVLGAGVLADLLGGRLGLGWKAGEPAGIEPDQREKRQAVLADEWRLFASAVSRTRTRLLVTAVDDEDHRPSTFFERIRKVSHVSEVEHARIRRLDLRGIVAELRGLLDVGGGGAVAGAGDGPVAGAGGGAVAGTVAGTVAGLLALLAELGSPGAAPEEWAGLGAPSSEARLNPDGRPVWLSPSRVETATNCALRWALESVGGRTAGRIEQNLGTLIHEIVERLPHGTREELAAEFERGFEELGLPPGWVREREWKRGRAMLELLATYIEGVPGEVVTEQHVQQLVGEAVISGSVDRLEYVDGGVRITDVKTGTPVTGDDAAINPQLAMYQLAINAAAEEGEGPPAVEARLVHVPPDRKSPAIRHQHALPDGGGWARELLEEAVAVMRGREFTATANPTCRHCPVRRSCPARTDGKRISE